MAGERADKKPQSSGDADENIGARGRYADPQDLQFGKAAREKEEELDRALADGRPLPPDEPPESRPRPGGKAEPDK
jgi:hypothetical protein